MMNAISLDTKITLTMIVAILGLDEEQRVYAKAWGMPVIEGKDIEAVGQRLDLLLKNKPKIIVR